MRTVGRQHREKTDAEIDAFIDALMKASQTLNAIVMLASRTETALSDEECDQFEQLCKNFGVQFREVPTMSSRPLKLHYLESHLWQQMRDFRTIAFADEGGIERLHAWWNILGRMYAPMRSFALMTTAIVKRFEMEHFAPVKAYMKKMVDATKRRWTVKESDKRQVKRDARGQVKKETILSALGNSTLGALSGSEDDN